MSIEHIIEKRRSTRRFKPGVVTRAQLRRIVQAGVHAPTGANTQNVRFVTLTRRRDLKRLANRAAFAENASAAIVVYTLPLLKTRPGEEDIWRFLDDQNAAAAIQNMCLMATEMRLATCWLSCSEAMAGTRVLNGLDWDAILPDDIEDGAIHGILLVGHAAEVGEDGFPKGHTHHGGRAVARLPLKDMAPFQPVDLAITGSFGGGDIGDDEMLEEYLRHLDALDFPRYNILLAGHRVNYTSWYHRHPEEFCTPSGTFPLPEHLKTADALLVTGGGTINTREDPRDAGGKSLKRMYNMVMPFARVGKPIFMSGQTIGPLGINSEHDALAKELIEAVDVLTVRDKNFSRGFIEKIGAKPKLLIETCDDAAASPVGKFPAELEDFFTANKTNGVAAINVTTYTADTKEKRAVVVEGCQEFLRWGMGVVLIPHYPWDYGALKQIQQELDGSDKVLLLDTKEWRAPEIKAVLNRCRHAIAGRYHFFVFCLSVGLPVVGMAGNEYSRIKQEGAWAFTSSISTAVLAPPDVWDPLELKRRLEITRLPRGGTLHRPVSFAAFDEWLASVEAKL